MRKSLVAKVFVIVCIVAGCTKEDDEFGYPNGIIVGDMDSMNDCSLPDCSEDRIVRLLATNVDGKIFKGMSSGRYGVSYQYTFDSSIIFYFCDLPAEFQVEDLRVNFSGKLYDACGVINAVWPTEDVYLLKLDNIYKK